MSKFDYSDLDGNTLRTFTTVLEEMSVTRFFDTHPAPVKLIPVGPGLQALDILFAAQRFFLPHYHALSQFLIQAKYIMRIQL